VTTDLAGLATPTLLLDHARLTRNVTRIAARAHTLGVRLRPHVKTHKCIEVARVQAAAGMRGLMVSTLAEARTFAAQGFDDLVYGVPIEPGKFAAACTLAAQGVRLGVLTDDAGVPGPLGAAAAAAGVVLDVWIKVDTGYHRCGVPPDGPALVALAEGIGSHHALRFAGLLTHAGHAYHARGADAVRQVAVAEREGMLCAKATLAAAGIAPPTLSLGSTPTLTHVDHLDGIDEVRAGNYVFFDIAQATIGSCTRDDSVLSVLAAVVHRDRGAGKLILDAGGIALSKDRGAVDLDPATGYGELLDLEGQELGLRLDSLSQEHGVVTTADAARLDALPVGARVRIRVNHACLTAAQHAEYVVHEGTRVLDRWVNHRGW
jgi:D-serine deaminase-like pyridoxal phosphate-dependent protein